MKVLVVSTFDIQGGAARAAHRLYNALLNSNINVNMLVQNKATDDHLIIGPETKLKKGIGKLRWVLDQIPVGLYKKRTQTLFSPSCVPFSSIVDKINEINPDIVHLHWVCGGLMKIEDIAKIKAPIVWSLHDNWAFTGGCHIMWDCDRYKDNCGYCPRLGSNKENDLSRKVFNRKHKIFSKTDMTIVGLSRWLTECSKSSTLLKEKLHVNLPNPIDTEVFKRFDKNISRELWGVAKDKKIVLFGALNATGDINKGFKELMGSLQLLNLNDVEFAVFGSSGRSQNALDFKVKIHYFGQLHDEVSLVTLYNAVDVMIVPSLQENLSNAILESLACGTPVVAFDVGGNSDLIDHKINGYLAEPFAPEDLARGIEWVLNNLNYDELSKNARKKAEEKFNSKKVAEQYIKLYKKTLEEKIND